MSPEAPFYVVVDGRGHHFASMLVLCDDLELATEVARELNHTHIVRVVAHAIEGKPEAGNRMVVRAAKKIHFEPCTPLNKET